jgi:hypothetical protein
LFLLRVSGSIFLGFSAPILIIAFLAFIYVSAFPGDDFEYNFILFKLSQFSQIFTAFVYPVLIITEQIV